MLNISDYFSNSNKYLYKELDANPCHMDTIENFYEGFIRPHLEKLFKDNKKNFIKWCEIFEDYADGNLPIFWIRKYESGSGKENVNDNRRTGTTVLVDDSKKAIAAFAYISNFDAQELYNIILNIEPSDKKEFETLMMDGKYKFHYDNGATSNESAITSFECLAHANSLGIFNRARLYLAHIVDVNGEYTSVNEYNFDKGEIENWKEKLSYSGYDFLNIFAKDDKKKIRVLPYNGDVNSLTKFLKAHFFRFVSPFNYYLVPGQSYEINAIFGKTQKSIGEHSDLTNYVKYRMYADYIKSDPDLALHYQKFEDAILIDSDNKIHKNFDSIKADCEKLGNAVIHVIFGASVGKEGQLLKKLNQKISNTDELYNIYKNYVIGDTFAFYDENDKKVTTYKPTTIPTYIDMLEKISNKVSSKILKSPLQIKLKKTTTTTTIRPGGTPTPSSGFSKSKISDKTYEIAAYYLRHTESLSTIGTKFLPTPDPNGSKTKSRLKRIGILGVHKGLLISSNIDDEIANATDANFKATLEEIKARGL